MIMHKLSFELLARYNQWMNQKLYVICAEIPDADRTKDMGAFFKSVHGTLNHLLYGDKAWMGRFTGRSLEGLEIGAELYADFDQLREARERMDRHIIVWSESLKPEWLASDFEFTSMVDGKTRRIPAWVLVTHMFNHQTHHRGQLTTLLKQLGFDTGITDLPFMPEFNA
jgi:uncharacterized damage-inducible protein DinB